MSASRPGWRMPLVVGSTSLLLLATGPATGAVVPEPVTWSAPGAALTLSPLASYETGVFDESAAEIVEYYAPEQRLFVVNARAATVEVLDASDPTAPAKLFDLRTAGVPVADGSVVPAGAVVNSVGIREDGLAVLAVESATKTDPGWLVFYDAAGTGTPLGAVRVGALPDIVTVTPDGSRAVARPSRPTTTRWTPRGRSP